MDWLQMAQINTAIARVLVKRDPEGEKKIQLLLEENGFMIYDTINIFLEHGICLVVVAPRDGPSFDLEVEWTPPKVGLDELVRQLAHALAARDADDTNECTVERLTGAVGLLGFRPVKPVELLRAGRCRVVVLDDSGDNVTVDAMWPLPEEGYNPVDNEDRTASL